MASTHMYARAGQRCCRPLNGWSEQLAAWLQLQIGSSPHKVVARSDEEHHAGQPHRACRLAAQGAAPHELLRRPGCTYMSANAHHRAMGLCKGLQPPLSCHGVGCSRRAWCAGQWRRPTAPSLPPSTVATPKESISGPLRAPSSTVMFLGASFARPGTGWHGD